MPYDRVVISSGHGLYVRGASGILDEVDEARLVVEQLADCLKYRGVDTVVFHDDVSKSQNENLNRIVDFHNAQVRDLDLSIHFNAHEQVEKPMGTETFYVTQKALATEISSAIAEAGALINRGAKKDTVGLFFLQHTAAPALLLEICFVDSEADAALYKENFTDICEAIADVIGGNEAEVIPPEPEALFYAIGACSHFGGPDDTGVAPDEGLAFIYNVDDAPQLFLPHQPEGTTGLARRLNPYIHYVACRWDYSVTPKPSLLEDVALVRATATGLAMKAFPADWGPHEEKTGRAADLSPGLMEDLGITTDDEVEVIFPYRED